MVFYMVLQGILVSVVYKNLFSDVFLQFVSQHNPKLVISMQKQSI